MWRIVPHVRAGLRPQNIPWIVADKAFDSMDAPIKRDTGPHTPMPYNKPQLLDHEPATTTKYVRQTNREEQHVQKHQDTSTALSGPCHGRRHTGSGASVRSQNKSLPQTFKGR